MSVGAITVDRVDVGRQCWPTNLYRGSSSLDGVERSHQPSFFDKGLFVYFVRGKRQSNVPYSISTSDTQRSLAINSLFLLLPELNWVKYPEPRSIEGVLAERFVMDFISSIPDDGGRIPLEALQDWVSSVRFLVASGLNQEILNANF